MPRTAAAQRRLQAEEEVGTIDNRGRRMNSGKSFRYLFLLIAPALTLALLPGGRAAQVDEGWRTTRLSERVLILQPGQHAPVSLTAVIATRQGLVVIDSGLSPSVAERHRAIIERRFGRDDFKYLINSHHHFDHTNGNQVFSEATIIGHESCTQEMSSFSADLDSFIARQGRFVEHLAGRQAQAPGGSAERAVLAEQVRLQRQMLDDLRGRYEATMPALTFSDRLTLHMGDVTFKLVHYGPAHTVSDIFVAVPEESLVFLGDWFWRLRIVQTSPVRIDRLVAVLREVVTDDVEYFVGGHGIMQKGEVIARRDYILGLWSAARRAAAEGRSADQLLSSLPLADSFPGLGAHLDLSEASIIAEHRINVRLFLQQALEYARPPGG